MGSGRQFWKCVIFYSKPKKLFWHFLIAMTIVFVSLPTGQGKAVIYRAFLAVPDKIKGELSFGGCGLVWLGVSRWE